jgi:hypothetical protein
MFERGREPIKLLPILFEDQGFHSFPQGSPWIRGQEFELRKSGSQGNRVVDSG